MRLCGTAEQLPEKVMEGLGKIPQRLKPDSYSISYGTAKAVPFQNGEFFREL